MIRATCGHELEDFEEGTTIAVEDYTREGDKCISYPTVCKKCLQRYKNENRILTKEEEEDFFKNKKIPRFL